MKNHTEIKIRGYHLDVYRHVNNARYLEFMEEARWALFEDHIEAFITSGHAILVVNINISYKSPATLGDTLDIHSSITRFGTKSFTLMQRLTQKGSHTLVGEADVTFVVTGPDGHALPIEGKIREILQPFVPPPTAPSPEEG